MLAAQVETTAKLPLQMIYRPLCRGSEIMEFAATAALLIATCAPLLGEMLLGAPAAAPAAAEREAGQVVSHATADPYRGIALGVECAWPGSEPNREAQAP